MIAPRYTIIWAPEIESGVADYWVRSDSEERDRLNRIVYHIDAELSSAPDRTGTMLDDQTQYRAWTLTEFDPPVRIVFKVFPADRIVSVLLLTLHNRRAD